MKKVLPTFAMLLSAMLPSAASEPAPLYEMQDATTKVKWAVAPLPANSRTEICTIDGEGVITNLWMTHIPESNERNNYLGRAIVINIYWDGSDTPAVSVPVADFFCQPIQLQAIENEFFTSTNSFCVFNSSIPMPYRKSVKIELVNDTDKDLQYFYRVDIDERKLNKEALYLHAYWRRNTNVEAQQTMTVLPEVMGKGRYLGTHWAVHQEKPRKDWPWCLRSAIISTDENAQPTINVPTVDDYINSGWWENEEVREPYAHRYAGRPLVQGDTTDRLSVAFYRYHVLDPLWFHKQISFVVSEQKFRPTKTLSDWSSTAFFYLDKPSNDLPEIQDLGVRTQD